MDDTLKVVTLGLFAFLTLHASLERRARNDATRQVSHAFHDTGAVYSKVESRGMFGMLANDVWSVDIYGHDQIADDLPFYLAPRAGWKGRIRHLRLHFTQFTLRGLPIDRLEADIPFVTYDLGHALYHDRLVLRGAGIGPAQVQVSAKGLETFILSKYEKTVKKVRVTIQNGEITLIGTLTLLGGETPFTATGALAPRGGRFLDFKDPRLTLKGNPAKPEFTEAVLKQLNPVLDTERDLKLSSFFTITGVDLEGDSIVIKGQATVPLAPLRTGAELPASK